jgi:hypothetical protein
MFSRLMFFVVGAATGLFARDAIRGVAKSVIGGAYKARLAMQQLTEEALEDVQDQKAAQEKQGTIQTQ